MFKNFRIGHKLILLLLLVSLIPLLFIGLTTYFYTKAELERMTKGALEAVNDSRAAHINHSIQLRQEQAKEFSGAFLPRNLSEIGVNDPQVIKGIQDDLDSTFADLKSRPTSAYKNIDRKTDIEIIEVWDVHGNIVASTDKRMIGKRMPLEYLQNVYQQGTYFRGFETDPLTGKNFLVHLEEIRHWKTNKIVGAVSLKLKATILNEITTAREGLGDFGETYVVDHQYRMITESRFVDNAILNVRVITEGTQACFKGQTVSAIYKNYQNTPVLGVQKYLPDQDWCLVTEIDAAQALAPVTSFRNHIQVIGGFLFFFILLFSYLASRSFSRPLLKLHEASKKIAKGDYSTHVEVSGKDEIGELAKAFNEMSRSLEEKTKELEEKNKALFKHLAISTSQKKELKEVNAELDSFVYTVSHDLRAPLRGIASFASFLEEDYREKLDQEGKDYIEEIRKGAKKMNAFIEDLLTLSRISRIKNPYEDVDIAKVIDSIKERLKFDIKDKQVDLKIHQGLPIIRCDRIKMEEVYYNLISNAIKFSSKNNKTHPVVEVGYQAEEFQHKFYVQDNGIGIDPKYHDQIFGIFKRLHTDKEYEGTGAGLSIIKKVIDDHQGKLWIESELGKGARFCFTIPKKLIADSQGQGNAGEGEKPSASA